jgi:hypothetical protein
MKLLFIALVLSLNLACGVALQVPANAPTATRVDAAYGSSVMRFGEFQVKAVIEKSVGFGVVFARGRAALEQRSVRFTVNRSGQPFS